MGHCLGTPGAAGLVSDWVLQCPVKIVKVSNSDRVARFLVPTEPSEVVKSQSRLSNLFARFLL